MQNENSLVVRIFGVLSEEYSERPLLKTIIATVILALGMVVPSSPSFIAAMATTEGARTLLDHYVNRFYGKRLRIFLSEFAKGEYFLTQEIINDDDFIASIVYIVDALKYTRDEEKVRIFARLLLGAIKFEQLDSDRLDEFLDTVRTLSAKELALLEILHQFELANPYLEVENNGQRELQNDVQRSGEFWQEFKSTAMTELSLEKDEFNYLLSRLGRTGLYTPILGSFLGYKGDMGKVSPIYQEFIRWINVTSEIDRWQHKEAE